MSIYIALDIILVIYICICARQGKISGFVKMLFRGLSYIISLIAAYFFSNPVGEWLNQRFLYNKVYDIVNSLTSKIDVSGSASDIASSMSEKYAVLINLFNIDIDSMIESALNKQVDLLDSISGDIAYSLSAGISRILGFALVFIIASIILRLLCNLLDTFAKLPVINKINRCGGMILGIIKGMLYCWLFVQIGVLIIAFCAPETNFVIENTHLAEFFYNIFPLSVLF